MRWDGVHWREQESVSLLLFARLVERGPEMLRLSILLRQIFAATLAKGIGIGAVVQSRPRVRPDSKIRRPTLDQGRSLDLWSQQRLPEQQ